jgi:hypothetical protein
MAWAILLAVIIFGLLGVFGWLRWREAKFLKKGVKETMGKGLRQEIEKERLDALRRKQQFEDQLKRHGF